MDELTHVLERLRDTSIQWDYRGLSVNPKITWEVVQANPDKQWDWCRLSANPSITWEIVQANPGKAWDWAYLSMNPSTTWEVVLANPDKPWDWHDMSINPSISWDFVKANPDRPWCLARLSKNPSIPFEANLTERNCMDKPWHWYCLGMRRLMPDIWSSHATPCPCSIDTAKTDREWYDLSRNPSTTFGDVLAHPGKPWSWAALSQNQSITFDDVAAHMGEFWNMEALSSNPRMLVTKAEEARIGKTRLMVARIQRRWRACNTDPSRVPA